MKRLHRQAFLFFLVPMLAVLLVGVPYGISGHPARALEVGPTGLDLLVWGYLLVAVLVPPIWGYRLTVRMARALAQTTEAARRLADGDFSRNLAEWAAENSELFDLEQSINATAVHLRERVAELGVEKARLEAILCNMDDGVLLVDGKKRIMLVNPAAESMFGIAGAEAVGKDHLEVTHHFHLDELLGKVLATSQPQVLEIKRAKPGEQILEARMAPAGGAGEPQGVLLVIRDVTRSRKLEQMRTEFVSNVTHELRTPLTAIRGFAETLLEGALDDPDAAHHFVEIIKRESDHLGHLIEDLLDLSRIESGKLKVRKEPVDLATLAAETVGRLAEKAQGLGVQLNLAFPEGLPVISGDPARLAQVLINLVDNGLKYTPAGGSVTVSAEEAGPFLKVTVRDTGVGIPKADLPRIFERFYRVDKARSRATGGTGLGLSIVKHIVDAHGGSISCVSDVGQGAVFTFTLPKS
jgi:two-component system, OmpR family, phosphate regulon sensor histidine kinase PhoR